MAHGSIFGGEKGAMGGGGGVPAFRFQVAGPGSKGPGFGSWADGVVMPGGTGIEPVTSRRWVFIRGFVLGEVLGLATSDRRGTRIGDRDACGQPEAAPPVRIWRSESIPIRIAIPISISPWPDLGNGQMSSVTRWIRRVEGVGAVMDPRRGGARGRAGCRGRLTASGGRRPGTATSPPRNGREWPRDPRPESAY